MKELIKIHQHNNQKLVNARELYEFLESKQQFSDWIENRIKKFGFIEGQDFIRFHKIMKRGNGRSGATKRNEYGLTIDMAKELAMVEKNEKGRKSRRYFIEVERKYKENVLLNFNYPVKAARAWADEMEQKMLAEKKVKELEPKAKYTD